MIEREVLGCLLKDNSLILETQVQMSYFSQMEHQLLFQSMLKLAHEDKAVDKITLLTDNYEYLEQLGGATFIQNLESVGKIENFETYEKQLIDSYKKRQSKELAKNFMENNQSTSELVDSLQELDELGIIEELDAKETLLQMHDLPFIERDRRGMKSEMSDLDQFLGGLLNSNSYIVGARPSMGKTAFMLKLKLSAINQGYTPITFSLEMPKDMLLTRLICTIGNINLFFATNPYELSDSKKRAWQESVDKLSKYNFEIYDQANQTTEFIRAKVRQAKKQYGDKVIVFIDYLTLIHTEKQFQSDHARVGDISKSLKSIAKQYECPVVTLAQLSRSLEHRQDKRPMLSDLRESGSVEEDADGIMFLYRDSYYNDSTENDSQLEINLAKHRNGPTGTATIYYQKETGKMGDLSAY